jgi:hypothetical protein
MAQGSGSNGSTLGMRLPTLLILTQDMRVVTTII